MTVEDQLGFIDNIKAGVHPNDLVFGKRQGRVPVVTPEKGRKRKDDSASEIVPRRLAANQWGFVPRR